MADENGSLQPPSMRNVHPSRDMIKNSVDFRMRIQ